MAVKIGTPYTWAHAGFWWSDHWDNIQKVIIQEKVNPLIENIFRALILSPLPKTKVVIVGEDPYPDPGVATGLAYSVPKTMTKYPKSLVNILAELYDDVGEEAEHGNLEQWARQGVLLLNRRLTCRPLQPTSHRDIGWTELTNELLEMVCYENPDAVYVLWGKDAQEVKEVLPAKAQVIESSHPGPMTAARGFVGSRPFSKINTLLKNTGQTEIDWSLKYDGAEV